METLAVIVIFAIWVHYRWRRSRDAQHIRVKIDRRKGW